MPNIVQELEDRARDFGRRYVAAQALGEFKKADYLKYRMEELTRLYEQEGEHAGVKLQGSRLWQIFRGIIK